MIRFIEVECATSGRKHNINPNNVISYTEKAINLYSLNLGHFSMRVNKENFDKLFASNLITEL